MLYYVPLESYPNRYTMQWSASRVGWLEKNWVEHDVCYVRIDGNESETNTGMGSGLVLNPVTRAKWAFAQTTKLIELIDNHIITSDDQIYFDDFWHPGLEQLMYAMELCKEFPTLAAFCHAQSVDKWDFTHKMRNWIRPIEIGFSKIYDYIFVNNPILQEMMLNINTEHPTVCEPKVRSVGHVFDSEEVRNRAYYHTVRVPKENRVVYSSRLDNEKNPHFFLDVVEAFVKKHSPYNMEFVICSGTLLQSNDASVVPRIRRMKAKYGDYLIVKENLTKEQYYYELRRAKFHMSTSRQDWISFCLLEALSLDCYPIYPCYRSFPEAFGKFANHLYPYPESYPNPEMLADNLQFLFIERPNDSDAFLPDMFKEIVEPHNHTWKRMLNIMGVNYAGVELE